MSCFIDLSLIDIESAYSMLQRAAESVLAIPQRPLFILLKLINEFDDDEVPLFKAIEYNKVNIDDLFDMLRNPNKAWEIWNQSTSNVSSDVVQRIAMVFEKDPSEIGAYPDVWRTSKLGLFDTNKYEESVETFKNTDFEEFIKSLPPFTEYQHHHHGFFNAKFNPKFVKTIDNYSGKEREYYEYWNGIKNDNEKRRGLCFSKQFIDPILPIEERTPLVETPCFIYVLKRAGVSQEIIDDLYRFEVCYGNTINTHKLRVVLNNHNISLRLSKVSFPSEGGIKITSNEYPTIKGKNKQNEEWNSIWLDFYRGHMMTHEEVKLPGYTARVPFLRLLHWAFEEKLLIPMNAYEFSELTSHNGFSLLYKLNTKEMLENMEAGKIFSNDCVSFEGKKCSSTRLKVYADFECSVDEKYHRPYCLSYRFIAHPVVPEEFIKGHFWGEDCGERFLKLICGIINDVCEKEKDLRYDDRTFKQQWKHPACTIYFHNLRYDFTFLLNYLHDIKPTKKGNTLYQVKGIYGRGLKKVCFAFKDTLPLLQMSLRKAGQSFLNERQQRKVKKEAFPYDLYTYSFFETHPSGWCTLEEFRAGFGKDELLADFDANLPNLPLNIYDPQTQRVFYKEYAFFYCDQDVRVLYHVMNSFARLLTASGEIEGVVGMPPFSDYQNPFYHLTISSLAYDYFQKNAILEWKQTGRTKNGPKMEWVPRFPFMQVRGLLRYIGHQTIRGGRVMTRDNKKWHYVSVPGCPLTLLVDYDGVSLYPSAISLLWLTEGEPELYKQEGIIYDEVWFKEHFTHPDAPEGEFKDFNDGWIHLTYLNCKIDRHFPLLCIKDEKTKLNEYQNFHGEVDTWVNAIDLFNLIDFQDADFKWDAAVVWRGPRHYECRSVIRRLFNFRAPNKAHPIGTVTKLMMNSIYGKSALKPTNHEEFIVDSKMWRKSGEEANIQWEKIDNWRAFFNANAYRIKEFEYLDMNHIKVKCHKLDLSSNFVPFGSNVLAMARRIIGRVMALAEDMEKEHPECTPGLFYTDTDSMHIRADLLQYTEEAYMQKYGKPIKGGDLCQFHIDFDPPKNFKEGEKVTGADESWFIMKKMYADRLVGSEGSIAYHQRMKGVPSDLVEWEHYEKIYNDEFVKFNLLAKGHVSFFYEHGYVGSRKEMTREIATKEAKQQLKDDLNTVENFVKALDKLDKEESGAQKRARGVPEEDIETEDEEEIEFRPPQLKRLKAQGNIEVE